jgi:hypothetical protein
MKGLLERRKTRKWCPDRKDSAFPGTAGEDRDDSK